MKILVRIKSQYYEVDLYNLLLLMPVTSGHPEAENWLETEKLKWEDWVVMNGTRVLIAII